MANVHDIASYIVKKHGVISAMKLQKLLYYCQAWSLVWDEKRMFNERIEAWVNGPVVPAVYALHRGEFEVSSWPSGNPANITKEERETVDAVLEFYGDKTAQWLSDLTHREQPWQDARMGIAPDERGDSEITVSSIHEYYSSL